MKKRKFIALVYFLFCFCQIILATGTEQQTYTPPVTITDTLGKKIISEADPVIDPKDSFKNILKTAITGDAGTTARLNPMAVSFVENYIAKNKKGYQSMKSWGEPYFNLMDQVLLQHGIPKEMKYLAVIESGLRADALSRVGALGPWNFMPATARNYGLIVNNYRDERVDYFKSTHAAAKMLTDLYAQFNDWLLVVAAYNGGPGNVLKAIRKSGGSKDFWTLQYYLPNESMNHVKKFIGTHYIFEGEGGMTTITRGETKDLLNNTAILNEEEMKKSTSYTITGRFSSAVIMKFVDISKEDFTRYNPGFDNEIALNGKYDLRLPMQKMNTFISKRYEILDESMQLLMKSVGGQ
ncbi:MAG TPA: lytic transglycosylase domain-containing protein [Chitinophagaceae bacterium]|nr:lytic transglycosylase domain-containing protein [Chitinophagaceae bacterium]